MSRIYRSTGLLTDSSSVLLFSGINFITRLLISVIIARTLGINGKGTYSLILTSATFLGLFSNLGIGSALTYFTASKKYPRYVLVGFSIFSSIILSIIGGLIFYILYYAFLSNSLMRGLNGDFLSIILLSLPWSLLTSSLRSIYLGEQRIRLYNTINLLMSVLSLTLLIISTILKMGISGAIGAWLLSQVITASLAAILSKFWKYFTISEVLRFAPEAITFGIKSYIANLSAFFNYRLDIYLVNSLAGTASVGLYITAVNTAELIWFLPGAVSTALFPKVATLDSRISRDLTAMATRQIVMVTSFAAILLGLIGQFIIPMIYGSQFEPSVTPFLALLPGVVFLSAGKLISADLIGRGKPQYATYSSSLALISTITLDLVLIPRWGITGAAAASSCAYFLSTMFISYWFCKETSSSFRDLYLFGASDISILFERGVNLLKRQLKLVMQSPFLGRKKKQDHDSDAPVRMGGHQLRMLFDFRTQTIPTSPELPEGYRFDTYKPHYLTAWRGLINTSGEFGRMNLDYFLQTVVAGNIMNGAVFAFHDSKLVACGSISQLPEYSPFAVVMYLLVAPEHRGKKLGEILTLMAMEEAQKQGFPGLILNTDDHRLAAIQTYINIGFTPQLRQNADEKIRWQSIFQRLSSKRSL